MLTGRGADEAYANVNGGVLRCGRNAAGLHVALVDQRKPSVHPTAGKR